MSDYQRTNGHHTSFHLRDTRSEVWASCHTDTSGRRYAVLAAGPVYTDQHRSAQNAWHIEDPEHARQLIAAAAQVLGHLTGITVADDGREVAA